MNLQDLEHKMVDHITLLATIIDYKVDENGKMTVEIDLNSINTVFDDEELFDEDDDDDE